MDLFTRKPLSSTALALAEQLNARITAHQAAGTTGTWAMTRDDFAAIQSYLCREYEIMLLPGDAATFEDVLTLYQAGRPPKATRHNPLVRYSASI